MFDISQFSFRAALFDLDGVVFNSEPQYSLFWQQICREYHPETPDLADKIKGQTLVQIYDRYFADMTDEQPRITSRLDEFERHMTFDYISGFTDFVRGLRQQSVRTAVVTSSNRQKMENVYRAHPEFKSLFDLILTSEDFSYSKPDPDCYLKGAQRLQVTPDECLGFEDSFNGLKAVRAAGMTVVGLATTNSADAISPLCDVVISDYTGGDLSRSGLKH